jgi:hypothetical protein
MNFANIFSALQHLGLTAQKRALHIQFSNPDLTAQVFLQRIDGQHGLNQGVSVELICLATSAVIPLKQFIGSQVAIDQVTDHGQLFRSTGVITEAAQGQSDGALTLYKLKLEDATSLWHKRRNSRVFMNKSVVQVTAGVSGGAGAEFNFYMYIHPNGSIRIKLAAHLCYGVGAKGAVDLEVNPKDLVSLMLFIKKNLLKTGFMHLAYIAENLFIQLSQIFAMLAANNDYTILKKYSPQLNNTSRFFEAASRDFQRWTATIKSEEAKLACAQNINNNLQSLIGLPPNSKGILVYSLCHWNTRWAHYDDFPAIDWDGIH